MRAFVAYSSDSFEFSSNFARPPVSLLRETFKNMSCSVVIQVKGSSVNPCDRGTDGFRLPKPLGSDVSGVVVQVDSADPSCDGVALKPGDEVWGDIGANAYFPNGTKTKELGAYAEYAVALASQLGKKPKNIDFREAGVLPKVALTSYKALVWYAGAPWADAASSCAKDVLILGGSGGTGTTGIQLARAFGACNITTTTSAGNADYCRGLGADRIIDYHSQNWWDSDVIPDESFDVVYDTVGQPLTAERALKKLRQGGSFVTIAGGVSPVPKRGVSQHFFINSDTNLVNTAQLDALRDLVEQEKLRMKQVQQTFGLDAVPAAFDVSAGGQVVGKLAINVTL